VEMSVDSTDFVLVCIGSICVLERYTSVLYRRAGAEVTHICT
jgi:hypothetical protein